MKMSKLARVLTRNNMKQFLALFAVLALYAVPAIAADDTKEQTEQSAKKTDDTKKDSGIVEKAVKSKAIDAVGNDGIIEKGAKAKVWLGD
jgi:hypothetical protein